jgi:5-oxoprolinase (ATP-hydrolysing)
MTSWQEGSDPSAAFAAAYQREFGFVLDRPVVVDDVRVRATGRAANLPDVQVSDTVAATPLWSNLTTLCMIDLT